jgi:hypothetical protein
MFLLPILLVWMVFTRPVGIFFIPAVVVFFLSKRNTQIGKKWAWLFYGIAVAVFAFLVNTVMKAGGAFNFLTPFSSGQILCGVSATAPTFSLPAGTNPNSLQGLAQMIAQQPRFFLQMAAQRFFSFWGLTRSFYAPAHNLFIAIYFYSLYLLAIGGIRKWSRSDHSILGFSITMFLLTSLAAVLSCDDWHNRFILPLLPLLIIMASFVSKPLSQKEAQ